MNRESAYHQPVLVEEVVSLLRSAKTVLDGTLGGGGHAEALLESGVGSVTGIDRDADALMAANARLGSYSREGRFRALHANYADIGDIAQLRGATFDGILLDLGISSRQVDAIERGFTFREGAPLDMRMSAAAGGETAGGETAGGATAGGETAAGVLNASDERRLTEIFKEYGDEPRAPRLAREIVRRRQREPFSTSDDLVKAIRGALGARTGPADFARLFQALRIAVNDEIEGLRRALPALRERLNPRGILAILTYHSGEDRLVKHAFRDWSIDCRCPPKQPICTCGGRALGETITRKAIAPNTAEIALNSRARSAKLRAWRAA